MAGDQHDRDLRIDGGHGREQPEAVAAGHADIADQHDGGVAAKLGERGIARALRGDREAFELQRQPPGFEHLGIVIDEDDCRSAHASISSGAMTWAVVPSSVIRKRVPSGPVSATASVPPRSLMML